MTPQFVEKPEMVLVGIVGCGSEVSAIDIGGLWQRFTMRGECIKHQIEGKGYEVHIEEDTKPKMHFCLVGVQVEKIEEVPAEMFAKVIPACRYAVFTHQLKDGGYSGGFKAVYDWLKDSEYMSAHPFDIQCYDSRFKGPQDPESILEIHVPIKPKDG